MIDDTVNRDFSRRVDGTGELTFAAGETVVGSVFLLADYSM